MKLAQILSIGVVVASFIAALYFYPKLPEVMASHWGASGEVNGYMGRFWGVFLLPIMSAAFLALFLSVPKIDPLRKNIEKFADYYYWFVLIIMLFFFYIYILTLLWNIGVNISISRAMAPALGILFYFGGMLISKTKRNYFIGIRTPWTLSSDKVWDKTHKLGGKLFRAAGILCILGVFSDKFGIWLMIAPIIAASIVSVVYSYLVFKKST